MIKQYCSYELAKLAKEAGFDEECFGVYKTEKTFAVLDASYSNTELKVSGKFYAWISAPELTHLQQWVYEKFKVWVSVKNYDFNGNPLFYITNVCELFDCPYKALESGLLEFLKSKQYAKLL